MGMFDTLRVEIAMPGCGDCNHEEFQTKSFDNDMEHYVITTNGELYREHWEYDLADGKIPGSYRREYLTDYHGDVIFYKGAKDRIWRDYHAWFTEGKLKLIWYTDTQY